MSGTFESNHPYDLGKNYINRKWCIVPPAGKFAKISFGGFKSELTYDGLAIKIDGHTHLFSGDDNVPVSNYVSMVKPNPIKPGNHFKSQYPEQIVELSADFEYCGSSHIDFHWISDWRTSDWGYLINFEFVDCCDGSCKGGINASIDNDSIRW